MVLKLHIYRHIEHIIHCRLKYEHLNDKINFILCIKYDKKMHLLKHTKWTVHYVDKTASQIRLPHKMATHDTGQHRVEDIFTSSHHSQEQKVEPPPNEKYPVSILSE